MDGWINGWMDKVTLLECVLIKKYGNVASHDPIIFTMFKIITFSKSNNFSFINERHIVFVCFFNHFMVTFNIEENLYDYKFLLLLTLYQQYSNSFEIKLLSLALD